MFKANKRFIAGAVCPKCAEMDKIVAYKEDGKQYRECVACGFKEKENFANNPQELATRVADPMDQIEATPVTLIDPSKQN